MITFGEADSAEVSNDRSVYMIDAQDEESPNVTIKTIPESTVIERVDSTDGECDRLSEVMPPVKKTKGPSKMSQSFTSADRGAVFVLFLML